MHGGGASRAGICVLLIRERGAIINNPRLTPSVFPPSNRMDLRGPTFVGADPTSKNGSSF